MAKKNTKYWGKEPTKNPFRNFKFRVERFESGGGWSEFAGFNSVSGMSVEMEPETYEEGGVNGYVHELPKQISYSNLQLERGLTQQTVLIEWMEEVKQATSGQGSSFRESPNITGSALHPVSGGSWEQITKDVPPTTGARKHVRVVVDDHQGNMGWGWVFVNAYPVKWEGPDLDASSADVANQSLELSYDTFAKGVSQEQ
ncbi:hypothetical protein BRD00_02855 [Halobacteriales archaeon QS_8_69_26]|nr:MAG: hypothetical protein BRD00_02855 [Halobacteriales archaeon QS_8_69_26]